MARLGGCGAVSLCFTDCRLREAHVRPVERASAGDVYLVVSAPRPRIGYITPGQANEVSPTKDSFLDGLRSHGFIEGENIAVEYRFLASGRTAHSMPPRSLFAFRGHSRHRGLPSVFNLAINAGGKLFARSLTTTAY